MRQTRGNDHGMTAFAKIAVGLTLAMSIVLLPAMAAAQSRTDWEMHRGEGVHQMGSKLPGHGEPESYEFAKIPPRNDAGWGVPPNKETINFSETSILPRNSCRDAVDYTYFQTFVTVPANSTVSDFEIEFSGMDDGSRITIFNSKHENGVTPADSYVKIGETLSADLKEHLVQGENRVVITQVDDCCCGNNLKSAVVKLNGKTVETKPEPPPECSWGDVHIRTPDGLNYDFQAAGEFILLRSTDGKVAVQARQEKFHRNPRVTVNTAVAMNVAGDRLAIDLETSPALHVNGDATAWTSDGKTQLPNGGSIYLQGTASAPYYLVVWPDGFRAGARLRGDHMNIGVAPPAGAQTEYGGLCGNLDGNPDNDYQVRDGDVIAKPISHKDLYDRFGKSWSVAEAGNSLFGNGRGEGGGASGTRVTYDPPERSYSIWDLSVEERTKGEEACAGITSTALRDNCILDVGTTGNPNFAESAKSAESSGPMNDERADRLPSSDPEDLSRAYEELREALERAEERLEACQGDSSGGGRSGRHFGPFDPEDPHRSLEMVLETLERSEARLGEIDDPRIAREMLGRLAYVDRFLRFVAQRLDIPELIDDVLGDEAPIRFRGDGQPVMRRDGAPEELVGETIERMRDVAHVLLERL